MPEASRINHHRAGTGEPLVLLHGIGQHWRVWQPVIDLVADEFEIVACDTPGLGASPPLPDGVTPTVGACADAFVDFFATEGLGRPHVAGNSMGGGIALELARRGAVRSVTAFSPVGFWSPLERRWTGLVLSVLHDVPEPLRPAVVALMRSRLGRALPGRLLYARPAALPADELERDLRAVWDGPAFSEALAAFDAYDFGAGEELRSAAVTVAWGRQDRLLPYGPQSARARVRLPWADHVTLGAGHLPYRDDPAAVAATLRRGAGRPA